MFGRSGWCLLAVLFLWLTPLISAQTREATPALRESLRGGASDPEVPFFIPKQPPFLPGLHERSQGGFPEIVRAAGMIFSATVKKVERRPANAGQAVETVAITLHVEHAIRGATAGEDLTISQWIGLWSSGQRYGIGQRVLLFLYPKSKLGLTSCVGGALGRFELDGAGRILISAHQLGMLRKDPAVGGRSRVGIGDFALAVRHADEEE